MKVTAIDHFVLTVRDVEATCRFYERVLGMQMVTFGEGRRALHFGRQKINLHQAGQEFARTRSSPSPGQPTSACSPTGHWRRCSRTSSPAAGTSSRGRWAARARPARWNRFTCAIPTEISSRWLGLRH